MLDSLNNQPIGNYHLRVENLGQTLFFDQQNFELYLIDSQAKKFQSPIFRGLFNAGRPSIYVPAWIDGEFVEQATEDGRPMTEKAPVLRPPSSVSAAHPPSSVVEQVAEKLGTLIPPGGRFWLAYESFESEGELMRETRDGLGANVPLVTTPLGFLLYRADCWVGLRDWHFPEGGREGPRKLQGNKAINAAHAKQRAGEIIAELNNFLIPRATTETTERAQARAKVVSQSLAKIASDQITK